MHLALHVSRVVLCSSSVVCVCIVNCVYCAVFSVMYYTVNVMQELFKSSIVCLILCILCVSCIMCFCTVLYELCILPV